MEAWARRRWLVVAAAAGAAVTALLVPALAGDGEDVRTTPEPTGSQVPPTTPPSTTASTTTQPPTSREPTTTTGPTTRPPTSATPSTRPPAEPAVVVRRGRSTEPIVALSFDAGSDVGWTVPILDTLAANGIRATFGITGTWADAHPDLVAQIVAAGHQVVNHSDDHPSFTGRSTGTPELTRAERIDQLGRADAAILAAAGVSTVPWFRPPYGDEDESVRVDAGLAGYRYELLWTVDSLGWQGLAAGDVVRRCLDRVEPGAIYLFHVGSASTDHDALQPIIDGLRARGYGFATAAAIV